MRGTRDQIVTRMQMVWCDDTARYRPIWERACANLIFKCVMLPSQKIGSNQDVLRLVMSLCLFLQLRSSRRTRVLSHTWTGSSVTRSHARYRYTNWLRNGNLGQSLADSSTWPFSFLSHQGFLLCLYPLQSIKVRQLQDTLCLCGYNS